MNRNWFPATALLALVVLTSGCMGVIAGKNPSPDASPSTQTISVSATGHLSAEPGQAVVSVAVVTHGADAETARRRLTESASNLREVLASAANLSIVETKSITTTAYRAIPVSLTAGAVADSPGGTTIDGGPVTVTVTVHVVYTVT